MGYTSTATYGGTTFNLESVNPLRVPGTIKQKVGRSVVKKMIPGRDIAEWELQITGRLTGTVASRDTDRSALNTLFDADKHAYVDGVNNGDYIIESIEWEDNNNNPSSYVFTMILTEYNQ